jgi:hypothetical protein
MVVAGQPGVVLAGQRRLAGAATQFAFFSLAGGIDFRTGFSAISNRVFNRGDYQPKKVKKLVAHELPFATLCAPFRLQGRPDSMFASRELIPGGDRNDGSPLQELLTWNF